MYSDSSKEMELPYSNITCRRKIIKKLNKEQCELPYEQNKSFENKALISSLDFEKNGNKRDVFGEKQSRKGYSQNHIIRDTSTKGPDIYENYDHSSNPETSSCSREDTFNKNEEQDCCNKSGDVAEFDFDSSSPYRKVKKKRKNKYKFYHSTPFAQDLECESDGFCKMKNLDIIEENNLLPEDNDYDSIYNQNLSFKEKMKKKKNKSKLQDTVILQNTEQDDGYLDDGLFFSNRIKIDVVEENELLPEDNVYDTIYKQNLSFRQNVKKKKNKSKLQDIVQNTKQDDDVGFSNLHTNHIKKKKKCKNRLEEDKVILQDTQESNAENMYTNHMNAEQNLKSKSQDMEQNNIDNFIDPHTVQMKMKTKQKNKFQDPEHGNSKSFTDLHADQIKKKNKHKNKLKDTVLPLGNENNSADLSSIQTKKKKKHKSELDEVKDNILTQALENFKHKSVDNTDQPTHINKILGSNELETANSTEKSFVNVISNKKKCLHSSYKKSKNNNENLEKLRAALISSALKSIGCKKFESKSIQLNCKKTVNNDGQKSVDKTKQSTRNKKLERKGKSKDRGQIKGKNINESIYGLSKDSSNAECSKDDIRKALITAALNRIEGSEQKHRKKMSSVDSLEHKVKLIHKNKIKSNIESNAKKKNSINEIENMRSVLLSAALAKMNGKMN